MKLKYVFLVGFLLLVLINSCSNNNKIVYNNVIASAHPLASLSGKKMFEQNGNAFDAAVAAAFTLSVVEPSMSGIGGRLQAIYHKSSGKIGGVDASTQVPMNYKASDEKYSYGYKTIGIPGVVAGLLKLHENHGSLPLEKVMAPSIEYAEKGYQILPLEAYRQQSAKNIFKEFEGTRIHFLHENGNSYKAGDLIIQKTLSETLKQIAINGKSGFYEGEVALKMVEDIQSNGGILTLDDLKNYKALDSEVLKGTFEDTEVYSLNLPSYGAITIQILQIMDQLSKPNSEESWAKYFNSSTALAYSYRNYQQNPDSLSKILDYDLAKEWAKKIEEDALQLAENNMNIIPESWTASIGHTTHLTAADDQGNVVSLTQTIGPNMGSKVASKDLGFLYAVSLGGYLGEYNPGDRLNSHISPTLFLKNGIIHLAIGAAGGSRIITAITQVAHRYLSQKNNLNKALYLPRVYPFEDTLWIEDHDGIRELNAEFDPDVYPIKMIDEKARFGRVHAVSYDSITKTWTGAADPDWEGTVEYHLKP
jgi:gamma-glutamyltranspeptidase/glutathione hydrolase